MSLLEFFTAVLRASCLGSAAVLLLLVLRRVGGKALSPGARCWLWLPVAALFVMPRLPDLGWHLQPGTLPEVVQRTMAFDFHSSANAVPPTLEAKVVTPARDVVANPSWTLWDALSSVWLVGTLGLLALWLGAYAWLLGRIHRASQPVPESLRSLLAACVGELRLRRGPRLIVSDTVESPAIAGLFRPAVLLPTSLSTLFDQEELRLVLLHEVGHLKRRDLWCHWLSALLLAAHWFNPLLWVASWLFRADREAACDAAVLASRREDARKIYGGTLLKLQSHFVRSLPLRPMIGVLGGTDMLRQRILDIAHHGRRSRWAGRAAWLLTTIAVANIALMAGEPSAAEKDPASSENSIRDQASFQDAAPSQPREETLRRIDVLAGVVQRQIEIRTKIIASDETPNVLESALAGPFTIDGPVVPALDPGIFAVHGVFTDAQFQVVMRGLSQKKGVDILSSPTITTRNGSRAKVEVVKNLKYATDFKPGENGQPAQPVSFAERPIGWSLEFEPIAGPEGRTIDLTISIENNAFEKWQDYGPGVRQPVVEHKKVTTSVTIWDGQTVYLAGNALVNDPASIAKMDAGNPPAARKRNVMIFATAKFIDPAGRSGPWKEKDHQGIVIPEVRLKDVSLPEAVSQIYDLAKKHDPRGKGIDLMLLRKHADSQVGADNTRVTLNLTNVKISTLLDLLAKLAHLELQVEGEAVMLSVKAEGKAVLLYADASIGQKSFLKGDCIELLSVSATSSKFEVGDRVLVKGRYQLESHAAASICLFTTQTQGDGTEETDPSQKMRAEKGTHDFELSCTLRKKGYLHVSFYDLDHGEGFGGVYFGSAQQMHEFDVGDWPAQIREKKGSAPLRAPDEPAPRFVPNRPPVTPAKP